MIYYHICLVLTICYFSLLVYLLTRVLKSKNRLMLSIIVCLALTVLFKFDFGITFFGLEYEDAYSFSAFARQINHKIYPSSFRIDCISIGSLNNPQEVVTYGGHFISYSTFISIFTQLFGFSPQIVSCINSLISFIILLILSSITSSKYKYWWILIPVIYCIAPIINVFNNAFLAESYSSLLCLSFLWAYNFYHEDKSSRFRIFCLIAFFMAILCKRENFILLIVPILYNLKSFNKRNLKTLFIETITYVVCSVVFILFIHNIFMTEIEEANDISNSTFSFDYFKALAPIFIKSLITLNYFSVSFFVWLFFIGFIFLKKRTYTKPQIVYIGLFICYFLLYTFHYRGYYFTLGKESVSEFETFRYLNNFYFLIPVFFATIDFSHFLKKAYLKLCMIGLVFITILSFTNTISLRKHLSEVEYESRIGDNAIIENIIINSNNYPNTILITSTELVNLNTCPPDFNICSILSINNLNLNLKNMDYYIYEDDWKTIKERFGIDLTLYELKEVCVLKSGRKLYKL